MGDGDGGMMQLWILGVQSQNWTILGVISKHYIGLFLKSRYRIRIFLGAATFQLLSGVRQILLILFWGKQ